MRPGIRLGIDVGDVRVGVARSDPLGTLAVPVETVRRDDGRDADDLRRIVQLCAESEAIEVVVGLPVGLSGREGPAAAKARAYAESLAESLGESLTPVLVRLFDERFSTVSAEQAYRARGVSTKQARPRIDAAAAAVILQSALDTERASGTPPGELVGR